MAKRVVILVHEHGTFDRPLYFLREISRVWQESGMEITVLRGPQAGVSGDLAINHVDLTIVPPDHLDFVNGFPKTINAGVADISKRVISPHLVSRGDGYGGPVVIKTDRNSGGYMEALLAARGLMPPCTTCPPEKYPIVESPSRVRRAIWEHPDLVVEKFLPERQEEYYCLRTWMFLGDRETHSISYSKNPIVKSANVVLRKPLDDAPEELRRIRREMKFDFGKFDYAVVDGRLVLYDVNRTPGLGRFTPNEYMPRIRLLAEGIHSFL